VEPLSLKSLRGGGLGGGRGGPSLGTLGNMLRKSRDAGFSLLKGLFPPDGNVVCGGARIPGTLKGE